MNEFQRKMEKFCYRGDISRLYCKYRSTDDFIIKGFQIFGLFEHDI